MMMLEIEIISITKRDDTDERSFLVQYVNLCCKTLNNGIRTW